MYLENQHGVRVASSVEDSNEGPQSNGNQNDDNLSLSLLYKEKVLVDTTFSLYVTESNLNNGQKKAIPAHQLQVGYKTYGIGHDLN